MKPAAMWAHLCAPAYQGCSDSQHYHVCAEMCLAQQSEGLHQLPRTSSTMHKQKHTPWNTTHICKPQGKPFHWTSDIGHKERASLRPLLSSNPRCWYWPIPKHLSAIRNHSPECTSLIVLLPSKRQKMQDKSSSTWFYAVDRGLFTISSILAEETNCSLERSPRGRKVVALATSRGAGRWAQPECSSTHHTVSPMVRCSPGRKEHAAPKTNTKPEHFLLYFSYRSFVIQKRTEERAIIKPLMCY